jgi:hypothetical protein
MPDEIAGLRSACPRLPHPLLSYGHFTVMP